jgi:eukaryotic-like serine/threonine-protein kinase
MRLTAALADRYRIERELGAGGMATVYLAEDIRHRRQVAIKVLRPDLAASLGPDRFTQEIEIAARLQHPHILGVFDSGSADGFLYYVMPYVDGESLRERLTRQGELPVHEAVRLLAEIADALGHAHSRGVVHRDIKPENVMLSGRHALVMDFGVAKALNEASGQNRLTTLGVALGTPAYMAPEQASADPHLDHRVDIYALGVMGYELLAGRPPFTGGSPQQVLAAHVMQAPEPLTSHRASLPPLLTGVIMKALEKRPADRWQTAEEMLAQLEPLATPGAGITPTGTMPISVAPAARPGARLRNWGFAAAGVLVLIAGGFAAVRGFGRTTARTSGPRAVAVLPFENVGGDSAAAAFTDGMQSEILTDLTSVGALQVISRNSVREYRNTTKPARQIGSELGVETLLQGQVQRAGNQVRVTVQLVDAPSERQVWAESYDRELTAQNIFAIQGDIATNVAQALRASLTASDVAAAEKPPTGNLEALDWYHRGQVIFANRGGDLSDTGATRAFGRAVALDSNFAGAWAGLASSESWKVRTGTTSDTLLARAALDRAVALAPASSDTRIAQAYYAYYALADFDGALARFKAVAAERPSDADALAGVGYIARRRGKWEEALAAERKLIGLDPRNAGALSDMGYTYLTTRRYPEAEQAMRRALIIDQANDGAAGWLYQTIVLGRGDTAAGRALLASLPKELSPRVRGVMDANLERLARHFDRSTVALARAPGQRLVDPPQDLIVRALNDLASGSPGRAGARADSAGSLARSFLDSTPGAGVFGKAADFHSILGLADAIRGRGADAIQEGQRAVALNPTARDATEGPRSVDNVIMIYLLLGRKDEAIRLIAEQAHAPLNATSILFITQATIRLDPLFDSIRDDPRIQALLHNDAAWVVR